MTAMTEPFPGPSENRRPAQGDRAVIDKAFALLERLRTIGGEGAGVSALARSTELSKSTAFRLLSMLERNGAVDKVGTKYRVGLQLQRISRPDGNRRLTAIREAATPFMIDLHSATGAAVHLGTLSNDRTLYLNRIYGHGSARSRVMIGHVAPAYSNSCGKMLLAHDEAAASRVLAAEIDPLTPHTLDADDLRTQLGVIRRDGISEDRGEAIPGLNCCAVLLRGRFGNQNLALSLATTDATQLSVFGEMLRRAAADLGRTLASLS